MIRLLITPFYAGVLGFLYLLLTVVVIRGRWKHRVSLGHGENADLEQRVRAHGNFAEYVPLCLLLMAMLELNLHSPLIIHFLGILLLVGRFAHAFGLKTSAKPTRARQLGVVLTLVVLGVSSLILFVDGTRALVLLPGVNLP